MLIAGPGPGVVHLTHADTTTAFMARVFEQQYFSTPAGERSLGMGGAFLGARGHAGSVAENPAALVFLESPQARAYYTFNQLSGRDTYDWSSTNKLSEVGAFVGVPLDFKWGGHSVLGAGYSDLDGSCSGYTNPDQSSKKYQLALAIPLDQGFSIGYGLAILKDGFSFNFADGLGDTRFEQDADAYRHRLGLSGSCGPMMRWGLIADYGHGSGDNTYDGAAFGGDDGLSSYGARLGLEVDARPEMSLALDLDWHELQAHFGQPAPLTDSAQAKTKALRPMLGVEHRISEMLALRYGYRYNWVDVKEDLSGASQSVGYHTITGGLGFLACDYRLELGWGAEYSWVSGGEFVNTITVNYKF